MRLKAGIPTLVVGSIAVLWTAWVFLGGGVPSLFADGVGAAGVVVMSIGTLLVGTSYGEDRAV